MLRSLLRCRPSLLGGRRILQPSYLSLRADSSRESDSSVYIRCISTTQGLGMRHDPIGVDFACYEAQRRCTMAIVPEPMDPFPEDSNVSDSDSNDVSIQPAEDPIIAGIVRDSDASNAGLSISSGISVGAGWTVLDLGKLVTCTALRFGLLRLSGSVSYPAPAQGEPAASHRALPHETELREAARRIYWHSAAHLLGGALVKLLGGDAGESTRQLWLCDGPSLVSGEGGFFYEFYRPAVQELPAGADGADTLGTAEVPPLPLPTSTLRRLERDMLSAAKKSTKAAKKLARLVHGSSSASEPNSIGTALDVDAADPKGLACIRSRYVSEGEVHELLGTDPIKRVMAGEIAARTDEPLTVYYSGDFTDLCRGPHLPSMGGAFGAIELYRAGASFAESSARQVREAYVSLGREAECPAYPQLERVYGIAFPTKLQLKRWKQRVAAAYDRDHRRIGHRQKLWAFSEEAPGSPFWLPGGQLLFNTIVDYVRGVVTRDGYSEVQTPYLYRPSLWKASGHWYYYQEDMFGVAAAHEVAEGLAGGPLPDSTTSREDDKAKHSHEEDHGDMFGIKPMNCPAHCRIFQALAPTRREMPLRLAEFSALHRNEASGALSGMTRVRRFHQDDGHIFCRDPTEEKAEWDARVQGDDVSTTPVAFVSQIEREVLGCLKQVEEVYTKLGFSTSTLRFRLATRPHDGSVGTDEVWHEAERALMVSLRSVVPSMLGKRPASHGEPLDIGLGQHPHDSLYEVDDGGGAFYGPKIDVALRDALGREHQCATIYLDFNLPNRMGVKYPAFSAPKSETDGLESIKSQSDPTIRSEMAPVLVHRAILGSVERMLAILAEHHGGKWPFWLSPYYVVICGVADRHADACHALASRLRAVGAYVQLDVSQRTVGKRVRKALFEQAACVVAVIGDEELEGSNSSDDGLVSVRFRDQSVVADLGAQDAVQAVDDRLEAGRVGWNVLADWVHAGQSSSVA